MHVSDECVFYVDVAKVDLDILSKYCIFNERFEFSMQHETDVAADFFSHHQQIPNNNFSKSFLCHKC